ncbi:MAG: hypothetical protein ACXWE7_11930, partial [Nitrososphaeraceae archaeon]
MKLDVLVVDDQLDNEIKKGHGHRRTKYKLFAEEFNKVDTNFEITLDFAENPISFITKIRSAHY